MIELFQNYNALIARVDDHILSTFEAWAGHIACRKGCDGCCRALNLFPVEAFAISKAFCDLSQTQRDRVTAGIRSGQDRCPFLVDHVCMVYESRPIICRTHGLPIFMEKDGGSMVDFCPENFKGVTHLPRSAMLDLDHLNTLLSAINTRFIDQLDADLPGRISVFDTPGLWALLSDD